MVPFKKCPVCGREIVHKNVEKLLKGGDNTAMLNVDAEVCLHCGERFYSIETAKYFEEIREKLAKQDFHEFTQVGRSFQIVS